ncbi:hypothetical protein WJX74_011084 [Apatococcus lobatus]|uniref:Uncharacterized protein n=1 Tax=Apatococcus lobatus TaxID=904363 RepID=A0AAW1RB70_9CHLO
MCVVAWSAHSLALEDTFFVAPFFRRTPTSLPERTRLGAASCETLSGMLTSLADLRGNMKTASVTSLKFIKENPITFATGAAAGGAVVLVGAPLAVSALGFTSAQPGVSHSR